MPPKVVQREAVTLGICLTLFQIVVACLSAPSLKFSEAYMSLCQWDCGWYQDIVRDGYHSTIPPVRQNSSQSNVAFFPAYPYLGRAVHLVTGIRPNLVLLLLAQLFCFVFWATLWTLLRQWRVPHSIALVVIFAVLAHPAIFFLVSGYSESLFLSSLLLFILRSSSRNSAGLWSSGFAGFAMSSARIIGIPAAGFPVFHYLSNQLIRRKSLTLKGLGSPLLISILALIGAVSFLVYCQIRFGHYNLYMETQKIGWGIIPDYGAIWKWGNFRYKFPMDRFATRMSGIAFLTLLELEVLLYILFKSGDFRKRVPVYVTAFLIFFFTLSGLKNVEFLSMIRYSLPWYILLLICVAHLSLRIPKVSRPIEYIGLILILLGLGISFYLFQIPHLQAFLRGQWFA